MKQWHLHRPVAYTYNLQQLLCLHPGLHCHGWCELEDLLITCSALVLCAGGKGGCVDSGLASITGQRLSLRTGGTERKEAFRKDVLHPALQVGHTRWLRPMAPDQPSA